MDVGRRWCDGERCDGEWCDGEWCDGGWKRKSERERSADLKHADVAIQWTMLSPNSNRPTNPEEEFDVMFATALSTFWSMADMMG
jgi:hypothetical protein